MVMYFAVFDSFGCSGRCPIEQKKKKLVDWLLVLHRSTQDHILSPEQERSICLEQEVVLFAGTSARAWFSRTFGAGIRHGFAW